MSRRETVKDILLKLFLANVAGLIGALLFGSASALFFLVGAVIAGGSVIGLERRRGEQ